jgi:hypothetical protein
LYDSRLFADVPRLIGEDIFGAWTICTTHRGWHFTKSV